MPQDDRLGQLALNAGFISQKQLDGALASQKAEEKDNPLGQILLQAGLITQGQLERLLARQESAQAQVERLGGFRLEAKLGEGGMGAVYRAVDEKDGRTVAVKVLRRSLARNRAALSRFYREARAALELDHPNIVRALDFGEDRGYHYIVMEYVPGTDVYGLLQEKGRVPEKEALSIVVQIANALDCAAEHRLVHRDIKPENILVDPEGVAKLADLGLILEEHSWRMTEAGEPVGTPYYLSPEQARGERDLDVRSDIYSLGAALYEMVTGKVPFEGETAAEVMLRHLSEKAIWPQDIERTLSNGVCLVIEKMMAKDCADRYQTPKELLKDLMLVYQGEEPASAGLPQERSTVRPSVRRRRAERREERERPRLVRGDLRRGLALGASGFSAVLLGVLGSFALFPSGEERKPGPPGSFELRFDFEDGTAQGWDGELRHARGRGRVLRAGDGTRSFWAAFTAAGGVEFSFLYRTKAREPVVLCVRERGSEDVRWVSFAHRRAGEWVRARASGEDFSGGGLREGRAYVEVRIEGRELELDDFVLRLGRQPRVELPSPRTRSTVVAVGGKKVLVYRARTSAEQYASALRAADDRERAARLLAVRRFFPLDELADRAFAEGERLLRRN